jgi:hypothetical protein
MTYKIVCAVKNNQVVFTLPPDFSDKKMVTVYVNDHIDERAQKLELLRMAMNDPIFNADIKEVNDDFNAIDSETL